MNKTILGALMIIGSCFVEAGMTANSKYFAQCTLKTPFYDEIYNFSGNTNSSTAEVTISRTNGNPSPYRVPAKTEIFGRKSEYQRVNFLQSGISIEIIYSRNGAGQKIPGLLYVHGQANEISCQDFTLNDCYCFAGRCMGNCFGK